jgi:hypothetical protein
MSDCEEYKSPFAEIIEKIRDAAKEDNNPILDIKQDEDSVTITVDLIDESVIHALHNIIESSDKGGCSLICVIAAKNNKIIIEIY